MAIIEAFTVPNGANRKKRETQRKAVLWSTGTHEDMERISNEGRLDEWCNDNLRYLADTFGRENIVSAVLHMDEQTPHIHATLVPIVKGERKRKKKEGQVKKRYRKKPTDTTRLCVDEIMTRAKLKSNQDTYAQTMSGYGLQRGKYFYLRTPYSVSREFCLIFLLFH